MVEAAFMPEGYHCELVDWDEAFGAGCHTFFPGADMLSAITSYDELAAAIADATGGETFTVEGDIAFTGSAIIVTENIAITSAPGERFTLTQSSGRHFIVSGGSLTLSSVVLNGADTAGGVEVHSGSLAVESNAVIQNCFAGSNGGGICGSIGSTIHIENREILQGLTAAGLIPVMPVLR